MSTLPSSPKDTSSAPCHQALLILDAIALGFDCSGFTQFVYAQAGLSIPRGLSGQVAAGPAVSQDALLPGDLVFFQNTWNAGLSHATIYVGSGQFIHASSPEHGVTTDALSLPYWATRYHSACRPW